MIFRQAIAQCVNYLTLADIEQVIVGAYERAGTLIKSISMIETFEQNDINDLQSLSSCVLAERNKSLKADYSALENQADGDEITVDDTDAENVIEDIDSVDPNSHDHDIDIDDDTVDSHTRETVIVDAYYDSSRLVLILNFNKITGIEMVAVSILYQTFTAGPFKNKNFAPTLCC